ncbi:MAG TPA: hypothetical protein VHC21_01675 [Candidatus Saccharimonadales bacterium]|nr:hypothetical protein [Candidatus Saccharimonadales bacterium]
MNDKPLGQYVIDLLDYADAIADRIAPSEPDKSSYFMTLVYIEDVLDTYGRGLLWDLYRATGKDEDESRALKGHINQRVEALRHQIRLFSQQYDFDETLKSRGESMYQDWHKLPGDHPNVQSLEP